MATLPRPAQADQGRDPRGRHRDGRRAARTAPGTVVLDVREPDEYEQGAIPGSIHIPRGQPREQHRGPGARPRHPARRHLRRRRPLGVRGQDARRARLHRRRLGGRRLQPVEGRGPRVAGAPHARAPSSATATSATCCCPRWARRASSSCSTPRCCCSAPAASARRPRSTSPPPASAPSASSTWTSSTTRTCSARSSTTSTASATARSTRPRRRSPRSTPTSTWSPTTCASAPTTSCRSSTGYDLVVDGTDNFPTRYLVNDASVKLGIPVVHGSIFRFEGMVTVFDPTQRPHLPRHGARAAAGRAGAVVRRGRRARRAARHRRLDPGPRGHQAHPRPGRPADRSAAGLRLARAGLPHLQGAASTRPTRSPGRTATASSWPSSTGCACRTRCRPRRRFSGPARSPALDSASAA